MYIYILVTLPVLPFKKSSAYFKLGTTKLLKLYITLHRSYVEQKFNVLAFNFIVFSLHLSLTSAEKYVVNY